MFEIKYLAVVFCGLASTLTIAPGTAQEITAAPAQLSDTGQFLDGVVAVVNEGIVLRSDLDLQIKTISARARENTVTKINSKYSFTRMRIPLFHRFYLALHLSENSSTACPD